MLEVLDRHIAVPSPSPVAAGRKRRAASSESGQAVSALLKVENLCTWFNTPRGTLRAVDGIDFEIPLGGTLGVVGESGSGKSVTALSVMRLVDQPGRIMEGSTIEFDGRDLTTLDEPTMEKIRGNEISMIFQEPMTSLNPVFTVGDQIAEAVELHQQVSARRRPSIGRSR